MACISRIFQLNQLKRCVTLVRNLTSTHSPVKNLTPAYAINNSLLGHINLKENCWIYKENNKIQSPISRKFEIDFPNGLKFVLPLEDPTVTKDLELPASINNNAPKEAARLIVIRRSKMKRHKLKKLRKKMKFEWAKRRQRREWNKEKAFQAELIKQCKEGEAFNAEKYVSERLGKYNEVTEAQQKVKRKKSELGSKQL